MELTALFSLADHLNQRKVNEEFWIWTVIVANIYFSFNLHLQRKEIPETLQYNMHSWPFMSWIASERKKIRYVSNRLEQSLVNTTEIIVQHYRQRWNESMIIYRTIKILKQCFQYHLLCHLWWTLKLRVHGGKYQLWQTTFKKKKKEINTKWFDLNLLNGNQNHRNQCLIHCVKYFWFEKKLAASPLYWTR